MENTGAYGTVQLELLLGNAATVANTTFVALQDDGKISLTEGIEIAMKATPFMTSLPKIATTYKELKDLHESEVTRVSETFANRFDIPNDRAEKFIELVVNAILSNVALFVEGKKLLAS